MLPARTLPQLIPIQFAAAINWCTHEYLFAFDGLKLEIPFSFVILKLSLNSLGLSPVTPYIKADLPGVSIDTSERIVGLSGACWFVCVRT